MRMLLAWNEELMRALLGGALLIEAPSVDSVVRLGQTCSGTPAVDGFQDQQPQLMELGGLRLILGRGLLMRKFWAEEEKSEALEPVLDQEELDGVSEETEAVISGKEPLLSGEKNDVQNQMESALVREKEALKQELEDKVTLDEENTMKIVQLNEELEKAKKEIEAHDELKSIFLAENGDLKKSNEERSFLNEELEAVFTITKKNEGLLEQLENKVKREKNLNGKIVRMTNIEDQMKKELSAAKDVISSLKEELQRRDLENVIKEEGMGDVERCETAAEDEKKVVVVKEEKQEGEDGPTRKLLIRKPKKKKPKRDTVSYSWASLESIGPILETGENKVHNERTQEEKIQNN
ncbi:uncharacterized protein PF3D7_1120000-like [Palaemon carinicauda]|uniref:uncharacterized protein PF3D7_1120000-like n=1 Tax=Palaemon carinicauda TaxID=392227 RepID=UPI0035B58B23